jgi:HPt (histidine-containing phosphotransfer) domain-containing protein
MRTAHVAGEGDRLGAAAHKLKSSSRSVGARYLGELCAALEQACARDDVAVVHEAMAQFDAAYADVESDIESRLTESRRVAGGGGA